MLSGLAGPVEPGRPPGLLGALHDEGAGNVGVEEGDVDLGAIAVVEDEGEGIQGRSVPNQMNLERCTSRVGYQLGLQQPPGGGVDPVGDHQVAVSELLQVGRFALEGQLDPDLAAAPLEDLQQPLAGDGREHMSAGADGPATVDHVDGAQQAKVSVIST